MKTNVKTTGIELTRALSDYVDDKVGQLEKFLDPSDESILCEVEIGVSTKHHQSGDIFRAEINLRMAGNTFWAESEKEDLYVAINDVKEEIARAVKSQRTKDRTLFRKGASAIKNMLKFGK
jgi:ribosomal subunit interface protein